MWINDGVVETYIPKHELIPDGWVKGRIGKHGGRRGEYDNIRSSKIASSIKRTISARGNRNKGKKRTLEFKEKIRELSMAEHKLSASKRNMEWNNFKCSCIVCGKETSYVWLSRKHKNCFLPFTK